MIQFMASGGSFPIPTAVSTWYTNFQVDLLTWFAAGITIYVLIYGYLAVSNMILRTKHGLEGEEYDEDWREVMEEQAEEWDED